jgi:hypothetical protein
MITEALFAASGMSVTAWVAMAIAVTRPHH